MITVSFTAEDVDSLHEAVKKYIDSFLSGETVLSFGVSTKNNEVAENVNASSEKRKPGRPPKKPITSVANVAEKIVDAPVASVVKEDSSKERLSPARVEIPPSPEIDDDSPSEKNKSLETAVSSLQQSTQLTQEAIRAKLREVSSTHSLLIAKDLVKNFGCENISEIPVSRYDEFVAACEKLIRSKR